MARTETKYRRRGRFGLLYKLLSLIVIVGVAFGGVALFFQVEEIHVEGCQRYSADLIITNAGVEPSDNLLLLSAGKLSAKLMAALPYVDKVTVQREYPTTLRLIVEESVPAVAIVSGERWWLVEASGRILEDVDADLGGQYPLATGFYLVDPQPGKQAQVAEADAIRLNSMVALLSALKDQGMLDKLGAVDLTSATEIRFTYDNRIVVEVLMNADYNLKTRALQAILTEMDVGEQKVSGVADLKNDRCYFRANSW